jgi:hypothetical protein
MFGHRVQPVANSRADGDGDLAVPLPLRLAAAAEERMVCANLRLRDN